LPLAFSAVHSGTSKSKFKSQTKTKTKTKTKTTGIRRHAAFDRSRKE
jgi:hypothetical protein